MQYTRLGRSGLKVSKVALGCMNLGWKVDEPQSRDILDRAVDLGTNFLDTADVYGSRTGASEEVIGRWLAGRSSIHGRDELVIATKVGNPAGTHENSSGLSAVHLRNACEASLRRLGTDYIDIYQLHNVDRFVSLEEVWQGLDLLHSSGKIIYVGTCNHSVADLAKMAEVARALPGVGLGVVSEQSRYNLVDRAVEEKLLPYCIDNGVGFLAYSTLQGGLLAGQGQLGAGRRTGKTVSQRRQTDAARIESYEELCAQAGRSPAVVATQWLLARPGVTSVLAGPGSDAQAGDIFASADDPLDDALAVKLDGLWSNDEARA